MKKGINTLKLFRIIHGLTPRALSEQSGIPRWTIYEYEHGYRQISEKHWAIFSKVFGLDDSNPEKTRNKLGARGE
jgi:hypothetical protein